MPRMQHRCQHKPVPHTRVVAQFRLLGFPGAVPVMLPARFLFLLALVPVTTPKNGFRYSPNGFLLLPASQYPRISKISNKIVSEGSTPVLHCHGSADQAGLGFSRDPHASNRVSRRRSRQASGFREPWFLVFRAQPGAVEHVLQLIVLSLHMEIRWWRVWQRFSARCSKEGSRSAPACHRLLEQP